MTKLTFKTVDFGRVLLIGRKTTVMQGKTAAKFVREFRTGEPNRILRELPERISPKGDIIIWMGDYDASAKSFTEIPGIFAKPESAVPDGFAAKELPECTMGILTVTGETRDITRGAHNKLVKLMKEAGYAPDYSFGYSMEYYSYEKYECGTSEYEFSYFLPCGKI